MKFTHRNTIVLSLLLHLVFLLIWAGTLEWDLFATAPVVKPEADRQIVFELQQPRRPHEVVETPEDAKTDRAQKDAALASDKNALARNPETDPNLDLGAAYAKGDFLARELPVNPGEVGEAGMQQEVEEEQESERAAEESELYAYNSKSEFSREFLVKKPKSSRAGAQAIPQVRYDNRATRAQDMGGMSFNTYRWDFAPYMLALKKRVERNIFPPPAFTYMGMIQGETLLRFRIYPDGTLTALEVLDYNGHHTLMETSVRAIEVSAPFEQLPRDFPEEYLEVTAKFSFFINRN